MCSLLIYSNCKVDRLERDEHGALTQQCSSSKYLLPVTLFLPGVHILYILLAADTEYLRWKEYGGKQNIKRPWGSNSIYRSIYRAQQVVCSSTLLASVALLFSGRW